jgi:hypothetical protein
MADEREVPLGALEHAEWFATIARKNMGFRFGPYTGPELGEILTRCTEEGIPIVVTANCGREFDWDLARDWGVGQAADWRPMEEAPTDNVVIMGDVNGIETRIVWWQAWECWREMKADGMSVGQPVAPRRWRELTPEDAT